MILVDLKLGHTNMTAAIPSSGQAVLEHVKFDPAPETRSFSPEVEQGTS